MLAPRKRSLAQDLQRFVTSTQQRCVNCYRTVVTLVAVLRVRKPVPIESRHGFGLVAREWQEHGGFPEVRSLAPACFILFSLVRTLHTTIPTGQHSAFHRASACQAARCPCHNRRPRPALRRRRNVAGRGPLDRPPSFCFKVIVRNLSALSCPRFFPSPVNYRMRWLALPCGELLIAYCCGRRDFPGPAAADVASGRSADCRLRWQARL